ncbi:MAG: HEAT repeat domain-containing protein [Microcoleaceae cyanobacterium]
MAPYPLILLLLTTFTPLDWTEDTSQRLAGTVQLPLVQQISSFTLAQEATPTVPETPSSDSSSDFPLGLILLGVGGLTITGGAVFILMRLLNKSSDESDEDYQQPQSQSLQETDSPIMRPVASEAGDTAEATLRDRPTTIQQPFVNSNHTPAATDVPSQTLDNAPFIKFPMQPPQSQPSNNTEPVDTPKSPQTSPSNVAWVEDTPRYQKLDEVEQWILQLRGTNPTHRSQAIWELGQHGDSRAIQPLVDLLLSSDSKQRSLILASLSEISTRILKPMNRALSLSLQDENAEVRKNAIRDLSRIYDLITQMSQLLQRSTDDPDPEVQEAAHWAINKLARIRPSLPSQDSLADKEMRRQRRQGKRGES